MFKHFFVILIFGSFCCFLYGIYNISMEVEENQCRMTYMFGQPQFSRVKFADNKLFPNYGLYYYYEGRRKLDVNSIHLNGAPVIFVPGNGGSHKQARSLASVALRKSIDTGGAIHFDYFTIDYNEELSGLYGGYLETQVAFLRASIEIVLHLYKDAPNAASKVVLIGHSMGGKVAQALLTDAASANLINTIISISTPLDSPVVNFDAALSVFYEHTNNILSTKRISYAPGNETNVCNSLSQIRKNEADSISNLLENVLLISVGGGNRDFLVRPGITISQFSDIHAMTSSIPNVWLSCDHLSAVWCLQFVLVINRFLFNISFKNSNNFVSFEEDKSLRLQAATQFFIKPRSRPKIHEIEKVAIQDIWHESAKRVLYKRFPTLKQTYNHMIALMMFEKFKKLYVEVSNSRDHDWIYGCTAQLTFSGKSYCDRVTSLAHYIYNLPSKDGVRSAAILDLYNIRKTYSNWTHVVLRLSPTHKPVEFRIDIHNPAERHLHIRAPRWHEVKKKQLVEETAQGTLYYKILVQDLNEAFQGLQVNIEKRACAGLSFHIISRICVPWARGFDRYQTLTESTTSSIYLNVPTSSPPGYNTSRNPVTMEIHLDPTCRFTLSYQFSAANTMSRIVRELYFWLPAHLTAVLCIVLKNQISNFHTQPSLKIAKPYTGFFQYTSLYLITGCRILRKLLGPVKMLPTAEISNQSIFVMAIVHSTSIVASILVSFVVWLLLILHGNVIQKLALRFQKISFSSSSILTSVITYLPASFGAFAVAIAIESCSGIALLIMCVMYLIILSNAYKDHLDNLLCQAATNILSSGTSQPEAAHLSQDFQSEVIGEGSADSKHESLNSSHETKKRVAEKRPLTFTGLQNFSFHITMFLLLFVLTVLNGTATLAWGKNYGKGPSLPDTSLLPTVIVLGSLSLMWLIGAPHSGLGSKTLSIILYACASTCVIYCQNAVYRINYVIASIYVAVFLQQFLSKLWCLFRKTQ